MVTTSGSGGVKLSREIRETLAIPGFIGGKREFRLLRTTSIWFMFLVGGDDLRNLYNNGE